MKGKSLISITDYSKEDYLEILDSAADFEKNPDQPLLQGKVVATLFYEPSTRTRLSFETAVQRLGGKVIGFSDVNSSSVTKGETLKDTIKIISNYVDLIIMRHPMEGSARYASEISDISIINAGDGANQHPSQTLLDLYSIRKTQGTLENLNVFMIGDLKYGRTVHSLLMAMSHFKPTFYFFSPEALRMPSGYKHFLKEKGIKFVEGSDFVPVIQEADIIYMTRVQKERFSDPIEYEKNKSVYVLNNAMLEHTRPNVRVLHPLPRVNEINLDVDDNPKAYYYDQARNGLYVRQAIICKVLGIK
jgi:aspartate carbamoyltransferase catalytic subunit